MNFSVLYWILCGAVICSGCVTDQPEEKKITEVAGIDKYAINKVFIRNGLSGEATTINDRDKIIELLNHLDIYTLEKMGNQSMENQDPRVGYIYFIDFYSSDNKISRITIINSSTVQIGGVDYEVQDSTINIVAIKEVIRFS